jgi:hypothetical protein
MSKTKEVMKDLEFKVKNTRSELERIMEQKGGYWELEDSVESLEDIIEIIEETIELEV